MPTNTRILMYSHDSFGLGHIRRCRTIAHALATAYKGIEILIVSGSPIIGNFDFKARVDFVRVPGLIKLRNGEYESLGRHRSVVETTKLREVMIGQTVINYAPDIMIVDKEPLGLRGELETSLELLKRRGTKLVLGLRDVLDAPDVLAEEWTRKRAFGALEHLYDAIWIYGLEEIYDPLQGLTLPQSVHDKVQFTGYLRRNAPEHRAHDDHRAEDHPNHVLVTTGGGGDGAQLIDSVLGAYEKHGPILPPALLVLGPFMPAAERVQFKHRANNLPMLEVITFDARVERRMVDAAGVVAMGGYNTFCEILSYDKPAVLLPRTIPRMEQAIRAKHASALGLCSVVDVPPDSPAPPDQVAAAIRNLATQAPPSNANIPGLLNGMNRVIEIVGPWLGKPGQAA